MICFEVAQDSQQICTAGVNGYGLVSVMVNYRKITHRPPGSEQISKDEIMLSIHGSCQPELGIDESLTWIDSKLNVGSQVKIKITECSKADKPTRRCRETYENICQFMKKDDARYRENLKKKIEEYEQIQDQIKDYSYECDKSYPTICFNTSLNDNRVCLAGHSEASSIGFSLHWVLRDPRNFPSGEEFVSEELEYSVGGLIYYDDFNNRHPRWVEANASIGDIFTIEIVKSQNPDHPIEMPGENPEDSIKRAKEYLENPSPF